MQPNNFLNYVEAAREISARKGVFWDICPLPDGSIPDDAVWELNSLCGLPSPPRKLLSDLGMDVASLASLNRRMQLLGKGEIRKAALSVAWQALIKAAVLDQIFVIGNKAQHVVMGVIRPLKVIATCAVGVEPWELTPDHIALARDVALEVQASGKLASGVEAVVRLIIDYNSLTFHSPLLPSSARRERKGNVAAPTRRDPRRDLAERKDAHKLPEKNAFWELVRIAFTEPPRTFMDELRFAQAKVLIFCGLRIGEVCQLPLDWQRKISYVDSAGRPASESGGISQSIKLCYFSEKRSMSDADGVLLYPESQHIPPLFEESLTQALDRVAKLTSPLRETLRRQLETGRILVAFEPDQLVPAVDLYPYLSGSPFIFHDPIAGELIARYRESFDIDVLYEIQRIQDILRRRGADLRNEVRIYFSRLRKGVESSLPFRTKNGNAISGSDYANGYFLVSDVEAILRRRMPTKLSDIEGYRSTIGRVEAHQFLFINPKRSLVEERNGGICDVTRYISVGRVTPEDFMLTLGERSGKGSSIFERYGESDEDKKLSVNSHAFRHLQNTELSRLEVADTIITKRFGRRSVNQTGVYDHRSLGEELDQMDVPQSVSDLLGQKAQQAFKLIVANKASGPLVDQFRHIQKTKGDDDALAFLAAEADGFHTTPYGFCINSFTVDPCPKHLECFNGCRHLAVSNLSEHRSNLVRLEGQLKIAIQEIEAHPGSGIGIGNQLQHAKTRLENVKKALAAAEGEKPFPNGSDYSKPILFSPGTVVDE